eukprot:TRINITY_DN8583_c0_g1_i1.p1 TRINITY_DN8583_c0_g1~~TRINITY_DN8583_c0_g1_i1.p1  ORF type:complete len:91 (+),score=17.70 TRINITY_DN8583_c0_g1_i1:155-427(+)
MEQQPKLVTKVVEEKNEFTLCDVAVKLGICAVVDGNECLRFFESKTGKELANVKNPVSARNKVTTMCFSEDRKFWYTAGTDKAVRLKLPI